MLVRSVLPGNSYNQMADSFHEISEGAQVIYRALPGT